MATDNAPLVADDGQSTEPSRSSAGAASESTSAATKDEQVDRPRRGQFPNGQNPRLRYIRPYWWPYQTFVKERWIGRQLLEVVSTEFRDRSVEYYRHALESGVTRINGVIASPHYIIKGGDRLENTVHRHEPPIANDPVRILHIDREREFIVISKPGSVPVHATGRYYRHTVLELLKKDYGINGYAVNRLDRLTSGLMILGLSSKASRDLANEFINKEVQKEYVARVRGRFPDEEITVDQPLLTVDRQMGLVIVTPEGKEAKTIFNRIGYDEDRDESIIRCRPLTGRTHQIRVHLQYLGHPIANDPLYSLPAIWGESAGKGGIDLVPQDSANSAAEAIAQRLHLGVNAAGSSVTPSPAATPRTTTGGPADTGVVDPLDREAGNIDLASPIRLSQQAKDIIMRLRRMKDEQEDWVKWKEVIFNAQEAQTSLTASANAPTTNPNGNSAGSVADRSSPSWGSEQQIPLLPQTHRKAILPPPLPDTHTSPLRRPAHLPDGFCDQCYVPLPDDPDPETLFIYLHARSYTTEQLGKWETPLPRWAAEKWDGDWRGWVDGAEIPDALAAGEAE